MRWVILAAGQGTRLLPYTADRPKCLVDLAGRSLLSRQLDVLRGVGVDDITVVGGYLGEQLRSLTDNVILNRDYANSNMVTSLMCARELLDGRNDVLVTYGDIVFEPRVARALLASTAPLATTVDLCWRQLWDCRTEDPLSDAETLRLDDAGHVVELGGRPSSFVDIHAQYMGLIRLSAGMGPQIVEAFDELTAGGERTKSMYMTTFLQCLIDSGHRLRAVPVRGGWLEVDSARDLDVYHRLYEQGRLSALCDLDAGA